MISAGFWRIARLGGVISLVVIYVLWWGRMVGNPGERTSADFIALYAAGRVAQTHGFSNIYAVALQQEVEQEVVGFQLAEGQVLLYNHMPYLVPLLALVVNENYTGSLVHWVVILIGICLAGSIVLVKSLFAEEDQCTRLTLMSSVLTFLPLFIGLWQGQDSALLYLGVTLWCIGILKRQDWLAATGLALSTIRPHIAIALAIPLLFGRQKVWWRFVIVAGLLAGTSILMLGSHGTVQFVNLLWISSEGNWFGMNPASMLNLWGFVVRTAQFLQPKTLSLIGWIIYLIGIISISALWRQAKIFDERLLGITVLVAIFSAPRLHLHDLILLIIPILSIVKWGISARFQPQWALLPLGTSFFLLSGILFPPLRFIVPYILFIGLAWLLLHQDKWALPTSNRISQFET